MGRFRRLRWIATLRVRGNWLKSSVDITGGFRGFERRMERMKGAGLFRRRCCALSKQHSVSFRGRR
jgi:hypothetical protein